jgi:hypothetical protein
LFVSNRTRRILFDLVMSGLFVLKRRTGPRRFQQSSCQRRVLRETGGFRHSTARPLRRPAAAVAAAAARGTPAELRETARQRTRLTASRWRTRTAAALAARPLRGPPTSLSTSSVGWRAHVRLPSLPFHRKLGLVGRWITQDARRTTGTCAGPCESCSMLDLRVVVYWVPYTNSAGCATNSCWGLGLAFLPSQ